MVYRRLENHGVDGPQHGYPTILDSYDAMENTPKAAKWEEGVAAGDQRLVVIDDEGLGFSRRCDLWHPFLWPSTYIGTILPSSIPKRYEELKTILANTEKSKDVIAYNKDSWFLIKASHWIDSERSSLFDFIRV